MSTVEEARQPIVQIRNLRKVFAHGGAEVVALDNVDLDVQAGEFLSLMGPSGSGKSTLLHILAGIDRPTSGECWVLGRDLCDLSEDELSAWRSEHIGFIFQSFNLIPVLTAFENVEMPLLLTNLSRKERAEHARTVLEIVGLGDRMTHYPRQLSGGQEQRVAIARALVTDPDMIFADEPTGDLDARSAEDALGILRKLNRDFGKTVIMVTHNLELAAHADRTIEMKDGRINCTS